MSGDPLRQGKEIKSIEVLQVNKKNIMEIKKKKKLLTIINYFQVLVLMKGIVVFKYFIYGNY